MVQVQTVPQRCSAVPAGRVLARRRRSGSARPIEPANWAAQGVPCCAEEKALGGRTCLVAGGDDPASLVGQWRENGDQSIIIALRHHP